ncbi:unnamed protein product [Hermetia illucens]|uniref:Uncharacterized protein n=1 Tax=Hermetia illucens TaxID=343691 RepID=A0A7R8UD78_HERIL|nr:unnamed protein product [Hermetia illucens]
MSDVDAVTQQDEDSEPTDQDHFQRREINTPAPPTSGDDGSSASTSVAASPMLSRPKRKKNMTPADEVIHLAGEQLKALRPDDEFEAFGKYIAHKLRSLKGNQSVFARKLINDVIFEGELEALTKDFKIASHVSGIILLRAGLEMAVEYSMSFKLLPVARNRKVAESLSWGDTAFLITVSHFAINGETKLSSST